MTHIVIFPLDRPRPSIPVAGSLEERQEVLRSLAADVERIIAQRRTVQAARAA
jgi:hypothetical protein